MEKTKEGAAVKEECSGQLQDGMHIASVCCQGEGANINWKLSLNV